MAIKIDADYYLNRFVTNDEKRLVQIINNAEIAKNTLTIPHPYTQEDAKWWIQQCELETHSSQPQKSWAIRNKEGLVCGGIGRNVKYGPNSHKDEIGYWLMRDLWGKGVMTKAVGAFSNYCFSELKLIRLEAPIFDFNIASGRVLEKNGFLLEGRLASAYLKGKEFYDALLYAKVAP